MDDLIEFILLATAYTALGLAILAFWAVIILGIAALIVAIF